MYNLNNNGKVSYKPMKDHEKRQYDKKGKYKGSIHDRGKQTRKEWTWATFFFWCVVIGFIGMYFYGKSQGN